VTAKPQYFEPIRDQAAKRWTQLESDPELAGPWHQLFKQVQSPRHILSELLQNADDAGATEAAVGIDDHCFYFIHNGEDFTQEHFASLCRFGYSNKRALHTIGFRGIGFKSTFSLGGPVELYTPTLSVAFDRQRFTEPKWIGPHIQPGTQTQIRVPISDLNREREVQKNLAEWLTSPVSLLFFKHIRRLRIGDKEMFWGSLGPGPVPDTEWMALHDNPDHSFLIARSPAEPFPEEALEEIRQERLLSADQDVDFPPCRVEIVLGAKGRLYVVLPTGVETPLPFACNAPFIQDPARLKIKDPETSPTNRWLLQRTGALAASVMLQWLEDNTASQVEKARAYNLFPDVDRDDNSLEGSCAALVETAFDDALDDRPFLLTDEGELKLAKQSIVVPSELLDVWPAAQVSTLLDEQGRPALCRHIVSADVARLVHWGVTEQITKESLIVALQSKHLPRPKTWRQLLRLWAFIAPEIVGYNYHIRKKDIRFVPVQGKDVLYSANEVVRLGEKRLLQSEADWNFLAEHLLVLNQNWSRFLTEQRRLTEERKDTDASKEVEAAFTVLKQIGLEETSDINKVVDQVAADFFEGEKLPLAGCVQLAQIAAKLGATAGDTMRFVTQDCHIRASNTAILFDQRGSIAALFSDSWCASHILHSDYTKAFTSCTSEDWQRWVSSGRARLLGFAPLVQRHPRIYGKNNLEREMRRRGAIEKPTYQYRTEQFILEDSDFEEDHWRHWASLAQEDPDIWVRVVGHILAQGDTYWSRAKGARALHVATNGSTRAITNEPLLPNWLLRLRELECLPDTRGFRHKPSDLLVRTPATESLMDVEPFVDGLLDRETTRPLILLLGARSTPTGPSRLLDCLRALARSERPPTHEVEKWYRRLDQMIDNCSTADVANIRRAFTEEKIILTEGGAWVLASGVFLTPDEEDVPGAALIRSAMRDLMLWRKIGIADHPTVELALEWLKKLPSGETLSEDDARRVRALLRRHPARIWIECGHWLNLARQWAPIGSLEYALTMQSLTEYSHLHEWVKQKTADLQRLGVETIEADPFNSLPPLASKIEERLHSGPLFRGTATRKAWLTQFGMDLCRVELGDERDTQRIRKLASVLAETKWQPMPGLQVIPYLGGTPAGTPRNVDVAWFETTLYVEELSKAKLAKLVPDRLGKIFGRSDVTAALNYCFGRSSEDVAEYMEENFALVAAKSELLPPESDHPVETENNGASENAESGGEDDAVEVSIETGDGPEPAAEVEAETGVDEDDLAMPIEPPKVRPSPKPAKPGIMERFARAHGFKKDGEDRFYHSDGTWIARANGDVFPWEKRLATGDLVCQYWPKDHCLNEEPLQLGSELWGLIDKFPEEYALILADHDGNAIEVSGSKLSDMLKNKELVLFPATYRLVVNHDQ
jgi:hypothetical protein